MYTYDISVVLLSTKLNAWTRKFTLAMDCGFKASLFIYLLLFLVIYPPDQICIGEMVTINCSSPNNGYTYVVCPIGDGMQVIESVFVDVLDGGSTCTYFPGNYLFHNETYGIFGFDRNILWVDKGCGAMFNVCLGILTCLGVLRAWQNLQLDKCTFE